MTDQPKAPEQGTPSSATTQPGTVPQAPSTGNPEAKRWAEMTKRDDARRPKK